jgi:2-polyprenyl-6-methoxyphenol hydroxylase-like FAD-dependent oxidoreductase
VPNFFRTPCGAGWALVGDAGYTKDPITAQGVSDAFRDAEQCAAALDAGRLLDVAVLTEYEALDRDDKIAQSGSRDEGHSGFADSGGRGRR